MEVNLLHYTPLWVCSTAIRKCWASEDRSDTDITHPEAGPKDKELIHRVGNKNKHASTLEHLNYSFDIDGISRACLQELARHRHASLSVKSTRYTLKELKDATEDDLRSYLIDDITNEVVLTTAINSLRDIRDSLNKNMLSNDAAKYMLPEAYKTSLVWTINARSLQNFLELRTNKAALWEIRKLAYTIFSNLPEEHKYLFEEFVNADLP